MMRAAEAGDHATLAREVAAREVRGKLPIGDAVSLAHAVIEREIMHPVAADVEKRLSDVRACAFAVDDVLRARMATDDAAGGEAALIRAEAGALSDGALRDHASSTLDSWRAVATWGMTRGEDHDARLRALADGSPLVRKAALHAITENDDPQAFAAVLEAARVDPDPLVRGAAVRALGRMKGSPADVALRLRDLWELADNGLRQDVASAFASPSVLDRGGQPALEHLLGASAGNDSVTVAGVILGARIDDAALRASAAARLVAAIKDGGHRMRIHAIAVLPLSRAPDKKAFIDALSAVAKGDDLEVRLAALGRLARGGDAVPKSVGEDAVKELEGLASPESHERRIASRALLLLADARDQRVQAWIERDLAAKDPEERVSAAEALAALGRAARAAPLLADEDAEVRTRTACTILLSARLE